MSVVPFIRLAALGVTTLFSIIVMAISAHLISQSQEYFNVSAVFCELGVAIGAMTLLTLPVMLVVDFLRRGAFTSMIVVEVTWLYILCILWVATAGETVYMSGLISPYGCDYANVIYNGMCQQTQAIEAFSFLNFIITLLYAGLLTVMAVVATSRGQNVWLSSVKETFGAPAGPVQHPMTHYNASAAVPIQPQYTASAGGVAV